MPYKDPVVKREKQREIDRRWRLAHPDRYAEKKRRTVAARTERYRTDPEYRRRVLIANGNYKTQAPATPPAASSYPYALAGEPIPEIVARVNVLVPKSLPEDIRSDVCQDILLALLEGRAELPTLEVGPFISQGYQRLGNLAEISLFTIVNTSYARPQTLADRLVGPRELCPDCGGPVIYAEGCKACGWRCGWNDC